MIEMYLRVGVCGRVCMGWAWDSDSQTWLWEEVHSSSGQNEATTDHAVRLTFQFFCILGKVKDK